MKTRTLLLLLLFIGQSLRSQTNEYKLNLSPMTPQSPTVAGLARQIDIPVSRYTGIPDITIPLYTVTCGSISVPITLSYHASGIPASQEATRVGLGWFLNAGGVIGRTVICGDDFGEHGYPPYSAGYLSMPNIKVLDDIKTDYCMGGDLVADSEPDLFFYSLPNGGGKFMFSKDEGKPTPVLVNKPSSNVRIDYLSDHFRFNIVDDAGTTYEFRTKERTKVLSKVQDTMSRDQLESDIDFGITEEKMGYNINGYPDYTSGWYLDRIVSQRGDTVYFEYEQESYQLPLQFSCVKYNIRSMWLSHGQSVPSNLVPRGTRYTFSKSLLSSPRLTAIKWRHGSVRMEYTDREDLQGYFPGGMSPGKVSRIIVADSYGKALRDYRFDYGYFDDFVPSTTPQLYKRLRLDEVEDAMTPGYTYSFGYIGGRLPAKNTKNTDSWGYYNGENYGTEFYSEGTYQGEYHKGASKSESQLSYMRMGTLCTVTQPTGGSTELEYESNVYTAPPHWVVSEERHMVSTFYGNHAEDDYSVYDDYPLEESDTITFDKETNVTLNFCYEYVGHTPLKAGGICVDDPSSPLFTIRQLGGTYLYRYSIPSSILEHSMVDGPTQVVKLPKGTYVFSSHHWDTAWNIGADMTIKYNIEQLIPTTDRPAGGLRVRRIRGERAVTYDYSCVECLSTPVQYYPLTIILTDGSDAWNRTAKIDYLVQLSECTHPLTTLTGGNAFGYGEVTETYADGTKKQYTYRNNAEEENLGQPYLRPSPNYGNGLLESVLTMDSLGNDVQLKEYNYAYKMAPVTIHAFHDSFHGSCPYLYQYNVRWPVLEYAHTINYQDGYTEYTTSSHDDECRLTETTTTVNGTSHTQLYRYPEEFTDSASVKMEELHIVGTPVESLLATEKGVICGKKTTYKVSDGKVLPSSESILQTSTPLSKSDCEGKFSAKVWYRHPTRGGNPMEVYNGITDKVYLWSYGDTYPVAEISGTSYDDVESILGSSFIENLTNAQSPTDSQMRKIREVASRILGVHVSLYKYDPMRGMTLRTAPNGDSQSYEYDVQGRLTCVRDADGKTRLRHTYSYGTMKENTPTRIGSKTILDAGETFGKESVQYFDGYGRLVQSCNNGVMLGQPTATLVTPTEYDGNGRKRRTWLPITGIGMGYTPSVSDGARDAHAYAVNSYDALDRTTFVTTPGDDMQGHGKLTEYGTNAKNSVKQYDITGSGTISHTYYAPNSLRMERMIDEDGHTLETYTNSLGNKVLERRDGDNDTYFVYNDACLLTHVLQPMFQEDEDLSKYSFRYSYDGKGRVASKTLPGCEPVHYTYDDADRIVSMQDGELRKAGKVRHYEYDEQGRLRSQYLQGFGGSKSYEMRNFYDGDYSFLKDPQLSYTGMDSSSASDRWLGMGKLCGSIQATNCMGASLSEGNINITTAYYYDKKGRVVERNSSQLDGHVRREHLTYTFTDQILTSTVTDYVDGVEHLQTQTTHHYDPSTGLPTEVTLAVAHYGKTDKRTIATYTYDKYGRMSARSCGPMRQTMEYNVRNSLTKVTSNNFMEDIHYTDGMGMPCYNGNISSMSWGTGKNTDNDKRTYEFDYDGLNRLLTAAYSTESKNAEGEDYTENVGYDANGNITTMTRWGYTDDADGSFDVVDDLEMQYNGNQLENLTNTNNLWALTPHVTVSANVGDAQYAYNTNGAMTKNLNKGIGKIKYDNFGHMEEVSFDNSNSTNYVYAADGTKLRIRHKKVLPGNVIAGGLFHQISTNTTDYWGDVLYEKDKSLTVLFDGGYVVIDKDSTLSWHYYEKDHLGSNRIVMDDQGNMEQVNHYYPFGNSFGECNNSDKGSEVQRYKFNGKEQDLVHNLNLYDYGARMYDSQLGSWTSVDPLAEKYYNVSPYVYCIDNPVRMVERDGKEPWDFFYTADDAAKDFGYFYNDNSIREDREYFSTIYRVRNMKGQIGYTYSVATRGKSDKLLVSVAKGFEIEATIHTHAAYDKSYRNNEFSGMERWREDKMIKYDNLRDSKYDDLGAANKMKKNMYLVSPNGSLQKYDYKRGKISTISTDMPSDSSDPNVLNNRNIDENHPLDEKKILDLFKKILSFSPQTYK